MASDIRRVFELIDRGAAPEFVDALETRLFAEFDRLDGIETSQLTDEPVVPEAADALAARPSPTEDTIMTITEQRPTTPTPARRRVGGLVALATAAAGLVITGIVISRGGDNDVNETPTTQVQTTPVPTTPESVAPPPTEAAVNFDMPSLVVPPATPVAPATTLTKHFQISDGRIMQIKFDGFTLWGSSPGSSGLVAIDTTTGKFSGSLTLPAAANEGWMEADGGYLYVPTNQGVVIVNGETRTASPLRAGGAGPVIYIGVGSDAVWLIREGDNDITLEKWDRALTSMELSVDLGDVEPGGIEGVGGGVYVASADHGLDHYGPDGELVGNIPDIGYSFDMMQSPNGILWVPDYDKGTVYAVDTTNDTIVGEPHPVGAASHSVWATDESVWTTSWASGQVYSIDPTTMAATTSGFPDGQPMTLSVVNGEIWVAGDGFATSFTPS